MRMSRKPVPAHCLKGVYSVLPSHDLGGNIPQGTLRHRKPSLWYSHERQSVTDSNDIFELILPITSTIVLPPKRKPGLRRTRRATITSHKMQPTQHIIFKLGNGFARLVFYT
jgi:hypothetical protein